MKNWVQLGVAWCCAIQEQTTSTFASQSGLCGPLVSHLGSGLDAGKAYLAAILACQYYFLVGGGGGRADRKLGLIRYGMTHVSIQGSTHTV